MEFSQGNLLHEDVEGRSRKNLHDASLGDWTMQVTFVVWEVRECISTQPEPLCTPSDHLCIHPLLQKSILTAETSHRSHSLHMTHNNRWLLAFNEAFISTASLQTLLPRQTRVLTCDGKISRSRYRCSRRRKSTTSRRFHVCIEFLDT